MEKEGVKHKEVDAQQLEEAEEVHEKVAEDVKGV